MPLLKCFKQLEYSGNTAAPEYNVPRGRVNAIGADEAAMEYLKPALGETPQAASAAAESLGHIDYRSLPVVARLDLLECAA